MKKYHLAAGALSYTLMIGILVSIVLSGIILTAYYFRIERINYKQKIKLTEVFESGLELSLAVKDLEYNKPKYYQLYSDQADSVYLIKYPWGGWDIFDLIAFHSGDTIRRVFQRGNVLSEKGKSALFLVDEFRPVSVSGTTKLTGVCYLPKAGVQSAYVGRVGYQNEKLLYGEKRESDDELPELNEERLDAFEELVSGKFKEFFPLTENYESGYSLRNSFRNDTLATITGSTINIKDTLEGKVWVHASKKIFVDRDAILDNVILSAPIIELDTGFVGRAQIFAEDSVILRQEVKLEYPSFIGVFNDKPPASIQLAEKTKVQGLVILNGDNNDYYQRVLKIEDTAEIEGAVYSNGFVETYGTINGHLTTRKFLVNTLTAVYENYIFNTEINAEKLNPRFLTSDVWFYEPKNEIVQWLD